MREASDALSPFVKEIQKYKKQLTAKAVKGDLKALILKNLVFH